MTMLLESTTWVDICAADDLEIGWGEAALVDGRQIAIVRISEAEVVAFDHLDPATAAPVMARGIIGSRGEQLTVASPLNKQVYELTTGSCLSGSDLRLGVHPARVIADKIAVSIDG